MNTGTYKNDTGASGAASTTQTTAANSPSDKATTTSAAGTATAVTTEDSTTLSEWGKWVGVLGVAGGLFFAYRKKSTWYMYIVWALVFGGVAALAGEFGERTIKAMKD